MYQGLLFVRVSSWQLGILARRARPAFFAADTSNRSMPTPVPGGQMRLRSLILATLLVSTAAVVSAQQQFTLLATVVDPATGTPPDALTAEDVRVLEDGVSAKVVKVESANRRVDAQILIDNGIGIGTTNLSDLRSGVRKLVE